MSSQCSLGCQGSCQSVPSAFQVFLQAIRMYELSSRFLSSKAPTISTYTGAFQFAVILLGRLPGLLFIAKVARVGTVVVPLESGFGIDQPGYLVRSLHSRSYFGCTSPPSPPLLLFYSSSNPSSSSPTLLLPLNVSISLFCLLPHLYSSGGGGSKLRPQPWQTIMMRRPQRQ